MPPHSGEQRASSRGRDVALPDKRRLGAYVANIVTERDLFHFVRTHGGGQKAVAWLAQRQLSVATFRQLDDAGLGRKGIERRAANGSLHRRFRGVYLIGSPVPLPGAAELAAVLACGSGSLISHRSAAVLWGLCDPMGPVHVTVVREHRRSREAIRVTQVAKLDPRDCSMVRGIPVTAPARTVIDFAAEAEDDELEAAISEARALKLIADGDLEAAIERAGPRRGVPRLRRLLRAENDNGYTRSKAERLMRRLARQAGLPQPLCNRPLHGYNVDFLWPVQRLVVEVDGYQFHGHRSAFERDRKKDQVLVAAGYRVIRVTWQQLQHEPIRVAAAIAAALAAGRTHG
jgi:very-short-patch-repair endonuclease